MALGAATLVFEPPARGDEAPRAATDWAVSDHARIRLIDAGPDPDSQGGRIAGLAIELDPGYLTYWRSPGEAGVPPTLDTTGSINLKSATILFPAPGRFSEDGAEAFGYKDAVLFPLRIVATDPSQPVTLHAVLSLGICERQCLPASADLRLKLTGDGRAPEAGLVRDALGRVPVASTLGHSGPIMVAAVDGSVTDDELTVVAHTTEADVPILFAEAADPWFVQASEGLWSNAGALKYPIRVLARPQQPAALPLRLTLVGSAGAIEVPVTLDAPPPKP